MGDIIEMLPALVFSGFCVGIVFHMRRGRK